MDFFGHQAARRRQSILLLAGFVAAMLLMAVLIHLVVVGFSLLIGQSGTLWQPSTPAVSMIAIIWLTILAGGLFRALDVKAGGAVLARRFGAVHASDRARHEQENQLLNVVAELAIASNTAQPEVYVLRYESSVNAFVLGNSAGSNVIVVTQGALDAFDRDELQAVIAHEFGHIVNGDLPLNMRLLAVLGGLMAIDEIGRWLYADGADNRFNPGTLVGCLLIGIGSVGVISGKIIRAAYSRQREFLADASAAQFTRNPYALASALAVARERRHEPPLHSPHMQELAHLCFQTENLMSWNERFFASHPTLQSRIDAIDPNFEVKQRKKRTQSNTEKIKSPENIQSIGHTETAQHGPAVFNSQAVAIDSALVNSVSDRIELLLPDASTCMAALFAIFASKIPEKRRDYLNSLAFSFDKSFSEKVKQVLQLIPDELQIDQLSVIQHAADCLRQELQLESRHRIVRKLEQLISVNDEYDLISYATAQLIRRRLDVEFPILKSVSNDRNPVAKARKVKTFDSMGSEFALLLSLIVEASGAAPAALDEQFQRVLKCYTQSNYPRRTANETGIIDELEDAFQTLYVQPKSIRKAFVQHCYEIMQHDGKMVPSERALLSLIAASLRCEELIAA